VPGTAPFAGGRPVTADPLSWIGASPHLDRYFHKRQKAIKEMEGPVCRGLAGSVTAGHEGRCRWASAQELAEGPGPVPRTSRVGVHSTAPTDPEQPPFVPASAEGRGRTWRDSPNDVQSIGHEDLADRIDRRPRYQRDGARSIPAPRAPHPSGRPGGFGPELSHRLPGGGYPDAGGGRKRRRPRCGQTPRSGPGGAPVPRVDDDPVPRARQGSARGPGGRTDSRAPSRSGGGKRHRVPWGWSRW